MNSCDILAVNLKRNRIEQGLSQEELSYRADIHQTYISDLERGKRNPSLEVLDKLAAGLKVESWKLLKI